ncbi:acetyltransferase [Bacillus alkalicellulosilyticus]|uniref:acetyltransferase n=1 Tax=Alkalihalobacterium alkalicellulosilyticum TaxID=1912214 RepID=UPI00099791AE|nr:acetyltransferase [Bacillus alkalicellulosilyticus]
MKRPVIVVGGGGHAKVLIDILKLEGRDIIGVTENDTSKTNVLDIPIIGDDDLILTFPKDKIELINGIGSVKTVKVRRDIYTRFTKLGYRFATLIHPSAIIANGVSLDLGVQVMAGAIIQPGCRVGENTIINTRSSIDHDCIIGSHVHIAPGVTLSGGVIVEDNVHVGTSATVIQGISIDVGSCIGAGSVVLKDVKRNSKVMGVPAKEVKS